MIQNLFNVDVCSESLNKIWNLIKSPDDLIIRYKIPCVCFDSKWDFLQFVIFI